MSVKKHILPIIYGILILLFSFESPSLLIYELNEKNYKEKELEEELSEENNLEEEYLKTLSSGGNSTFIPIDSGFANTNIHAYPQERKNNFEVQSFKITFHPPLYILFCSLKLDYC